MRCRQQTLDAIEPPEESRQPIEDGLSGFTEIQPLPHVRDLPGLTTPMPSWSAFTAIAESSPCTAVLSHSDPTHPELNITKIDPDISHVAIRKPTMQLPTELLTHIAEKHYFISIEQCFPASDDLKATDTRQYRSARRIQAAWRAWLIRTLVASNALGMIGTHVHVRGTHHVSTAMSQGKGTGWSSRDRNNQVKN